MADKVTDLISQADRMRSDRSVAEASWQQIHAQIIPMASAILQSDKSGALNRTEVVDNTGEQAHELLAAALVTILTPNLIDWFMLRAVDEELNEDDEVVRWFEDCGRRMSKIFRSPESGFAACQHEKYQDVSGFGTGGSFMPYVQGKGLRFVSVPLKQLLIAEDAHGFVDRVTRDFELTARQAVGEWGNKAGEKAVQAAQDPKRAEEVFRFIHAVYPRADYVEGSNLARNSRLASCYINVTEKHEIVEGGFRSMPYAAPRWRKRSGEIYGRGPGHVALADVKMLQRGARVNIRGAEKVMDPPLLAADDGIVSQIRTGNGRITYFRRDAFSTSDPVKPLLTGARPDIGEDILTGIRTRIENAFFKPLIQMIRKDRMTATEVLQVVEEGQKVMGPYLGRMQSEDLGPIINRAFPVLLEKGVFAPMPAVLQGREWTIEYVSPEARKQRIAQVRGLAQLFEIAAPIASVRPEIFDNLEVDTTFRDAADVLGLPRRWVAKPDDVAQIRQARAEAQQQERDQQTAIDGMTAGANMVRALPALRQSLQSPTEAVGVAA